ncbi:hypothetical protein [Hymenobacter sp. IS2118]|uniref:hypothetical protein n=1 Tax=Hymenobacter sp. IS2118 TaxID=1505605 RepID=UPI0005553C62|nr:hypothetical protein [Hymenobacter sp. IS2118]
MALKDFDQLVTEINTAVHSDGPQGKTTALSLGNVLKSIAKELTTLPQEAAVAATSKADLDASGRVPSSQLPSYVDDVLEVESFDALPGTGEAGKIYLTLDTNQQYRWGGTQFVEIGKSPVFYTATGQNTDGGMTQKAITDALSGIDDLTTNKAILIKADRSKVFYTGNGTLAMDNADDAVVRAFNDAEAGDYVYITAPVNMPFANQFTLLCRIKGGSNVNLGGFPITAINSQDCLGVASSGAGEVYGYGSVLTAVGSYAFYTTAGIAGQYRLLNLHLRGINGGGGALIRSGNYYHEGSVSALATLAPWIGINIIGVGGFSYELVGDLTVGGIAWGVYVTNTSVARLRNGRLTLQSAGCLMGKLLHQATLEIEQYVIDLTLRPVDGGIYCLKSTNTVTLTDVTVIGGSIIAVGNGSTLILRGNTTLPTAYGIAHLQSLGVVVDDQRPTVGALAVATTSTLGGIKIGSGLGVLADGTVYATGSIGGSPGISVPVDFGAGADGPATLGAITVPWATRSGSVYTMIRTAYLTELTIPENTVLNVNGHKLFVQSTLNNSGIIRGSGNNGLSATAAAGAAAPAAAVGTEAGAGGRGGAGGAATATAGGAAPQAAGIIGGGGGSTAGGGGGASAGGAGGISRTATAITARPVYDLRPVLTNGIALMLGGNPGNGGAGGAGTGTAATGGGGGSGGNGGGVLDIWAGQIAGTGAFEANGGNGGNGGNGAGVNTGGGGGGAGGGGGFIRLVYASKTYTGTVSVVGGAGGSGGVGNGTGAAGSSGGAGLEGNKIEFNATTATWTTA